ncbi:MAG: hypothetical protein GXY08_12915 [Ruminococcus sp.]|nr:hypothetical protein [Ruminococcus sp.]
MKKFIALICLTAMLTGCGSAGGSSSSKQEKTSAEPATEAVTEEATDVPGDDVLSMSTSYKATLESLKNSGAESFSICDLTGGKGPEVLAVRVKDGDINRIKLYRYQQDSGESKLLGTFDNYISYAAGSKHISYGRYDNDTGIETTDFMHISDDDNLVSDGDLRRTYKETADGASGQFWKNEDTITESEYLSAMDELSAGPVRDIGNDFKLEEDIIDTVLGEYGTWQKAYSTYLLSCLPDVDDVDNAGFSVLDINGDNIPELFYSSGYYHVSPVKVLTMKDGGLRCLGSFGSYGSVVYYPDTNELLSSNMGMGYYSGAYFTLGSNGNFTMNLSFDDNAGALDPEGDELPVYNLNDQKVDKGVYDATLSAYSKMKFYSLGGDNVLSKDKINGLANDVYNAPSLNAGMVEPEPTGEISDRYKSILSKFYYSCQLDLTDIEITGSPNISGNKFAIYDVDCDGKDELIIEVSNTFVAEMVTVIYGEDANGEVAVELLTSPNNTYYDNGIIEAGDSHNQGISGSFWPYTMYVWDSAKDKYDFNMYVSAWDKEAYPEGYPEEADKSGTGFVYYMNDDPMGTTVDPVDFDVYEKWHNGILDGAKPISMPWYNITEENIGI